MLVKKLELPKFKIKTETVNQYNRKTQIQTSLSYDPVSLEFHDDRTGVTTRLWQNYYSYYFADTSYTSSGITNNPAYQDTRYSLKQYNYGMDTPGNLNKDGSVRGRFFNKINIYVLTTTNRHRYLKYTLVNPLMTDWSHDGLDQETSKFLSSKASVVYEDVLYEEGTVDDAGDSGAFAQSHYDKYPSPLLNQNNQLLGNPSDNLPSRLTKQLPSLGAVNYPTLTDSLMAAKQEQAREYAGYSFSQETKTAVISQSYSETVTTGGNTFTRTLSGTEATMVQNITVSQNGIV